LLAPSTSSNINTLSLHVLTHYFPTPYALSAAIQPRPVPHRCKNLHDFVFSTVVVAEAVVGVGSVDAVDDNVDVVVAQAGAMAEEVAASAAEEVSDTRNPASM
jgi:hypothetical protein